MSLSSRPKQNSRLFHPFRISSTELKIKKKKTAEERRRKKEEKGREREERGKRKGGRKTE